MNEWMNEWMRMLYYHKWHGYCGDIYNPILEKCQNGNFAGEV